MLTVTVNTSQEVTGHVLILVTGERRGALEKQTCAEGRLSVLTTRTESSVSRTAELVPLLHITNVTMGNVSPRIN